MTQTQSLSSSVLKIEISFPTKNLQMMTDTLQKKFSQVHDHQIVEVLVMRESKDDFKLEFKFTGSDAKIKLQLTEALEYFKTDKSKIVFEDHPMIQELMTNTSAICNTLRTKAGHFRVDSEKRYIVQKITVVWKLVNIEDSYN